MPRGDRTGPSGMGPMTGRAAGYCAGYSAPGYMNPFGGRGLGFARGFRGGGRGYGRGFGFYVPVTPYVNPMYAGYNPAPGSAPQYISPEAPDYSASHELEMLKNQADYLLSTLDGIKKRIEELEAGASEKKEKK